MRRNGNSLQSMVFFTLLLWGQQALAQGDLDVGFSRDQGTITLHAIEVPFDEVLDAIGEAAGVEIVRQENVDTPVSIDLVDVPLKTALARLLGSTNYAMKEDPETQLPVRVWLMSSVDLDAIARMRKAQQSEKKAKPAPRKAPRQEVGDGSEVSSQLRAALRLLGGGESELEALDKFGLTPEEKEELLQVLDEIEAGDFSGEP